MALSLHSSNEPGELSQWLCHDDSTIKYHLGYYYYYYYTGRPAWTHARSTSTSVFGDGRIPAHAYPIRPHAARFHERRISSVKFTSTHLHGNAGGRGPRDRRFVRFWASGEQSSQKCVIPCLGRRRTAVLQRKCFYPTYTVV